MAWTSIETAPKDGTKILARDEEGTQRWTWFDFGGWCYTGWRENEDQEEFESDEWWEPTEWDAPQARGWMGDRSGGPWGPSD